MFTRAALLVALLVAASTSHASAAPISTVYVHGTGIAAAEQAVRAAGLQPITSFRKIGVVAARGTSTQITSARAQSGVTHVEASKPVRFLGSTSHTATRGLDARDSLGLTGAGVSVAVIDSGVDPTHPSFGGRIVRNLKSLCPDGSTDTGCIVPVPNFLDTDTTSLGGHGTHVTGIAIGGDVQTTGGPVIRGAASGA